MVMRNWTWSPRRTLVKHGARECVKCLYYHSPVLLLKVQVTHSTAALDALYKSSKLLHRAVRVGGLHDVLGTCGVFGAASTHTEVHVSKELREDVRTRCVFGVSDVPLLKLRRSSLLRPVGEDAPLGAFHDILAHPSR